MRSSPDPVLYNLLDEALLGAEDDVGHREKLTLPGLIARLSQGAPTALTGVQAHQQHAVHAFLVQLSAIALSRDGTAELAHDEPGWRKLLVAAAKKDGAGPESFALVVPDLAKPAFLQPPVPEGNLNALKSEHARPSSELDVLITSKNHDVKIDRIERPGPEHWVFALISLQTMQGFLGAGNYGIARMNGGFASRPCVGFASGNGLSERFSRDTEAVLAARDALIREHGFAQKSELGLIWCAPWNGTTSLAFRELDPFFIEVCRRIRLTNGADGSLIARRGSSKAARVDSKASTGNTGDPWTPVSHDGKALTMPEAGFGYDRVQQLLFEEEFHSGVAGAPREGDRFWLGQVLVRGQGKTGGYHERWIPIPPKARRLFSKSSERSRLGERSRAWVERARVARLKILRPALLTLLQGSPEKLDFEDGRVDSYLRRLDVAIDLEFFPLLFEHADAPSEVADEVFEKRLFKLAEEQFLSARDSLPVPSARRWRAEAKSSAVLVGAAHNNFKLAFPPKPATDAGAVEGDSP